jgi:hypothetical protein
MRTYTKQNSQEFRVATRTAFSLPFRCHEVATLLFEASYKGAEWDQFVEIVDEPMFLGPKTFVQGITYCDLQDGKLTEAFLFSFFFLFLLSFLSFSSFIIANFDVVIRNNNKRVHVGSFELDQRQYVRCNIQNFVQSAASLICWVSIVLYNIT